MFILHDILRTEDSSKALIALETLSQYINTFDERGQTPLIILARRRYANAKTARIFMKACIEAGADINLHNGDNRTPLYHAVDVGSFFAVDALLNYHPRLDLRVDGSYSIVHKAVLIGHQKIVRALCKKSSTQVLRMRDSVTGDTFLHDIAIRPSLVKLLDKLASYEVLDHVLSVRNRQGMTPFDCAIQHMCFQSAVILDELKHGIY